MRLVDVTRVLLTSIAVKCSFSYFSHETYELTNRSVAFRPIMHADRGVPPTRALSLSLSSEFISLARNAPDFLDVDRVGRRVASRQTVTSMFEVDVRYKIH